MDAPYRERILKAASFTSSVPLATEGSKEKQEHKAEISTPFHVGSDLMHEKPFQKKWCQKKLSL